MELSAGLALVGPCGIAHVEIATVIGLVFEDAAENHGDTAFTDRGIIRGEPFSTQTECDIDTSRATIFLGGVGREQRNEIESKINLTKGT